MAFNQVRLRHIDPERSQPMHIVFIKKPSPQHANPQAGTPGEPNCLGGGEPGNQKVKDLQILGGGIGVGSAMLSILAFAGCETYSSETLPQNASGQHPGVLTAGDTIKLSFTAAPELNQSEKIEPDGRVNCP